MSDTPETQKAVMESNGQWSFVLKECCERLERERDEAFELLASEKTTRNHIINRSVEVERQRDEAREERNKLTSLNESYAACWDEIKDALHESEQGDKTCDLDRVLKAIRERDEAREILQAVIKTGKRLERERDDAREKYATEATEHMLAVNKLCGERDEAVEALNKILKNE